MFIFSELELDQVPLENNIAGSIEAEVPIVKGNLFLLFCLVNVCQEYIFFII